MTNPVVLDALQEAHAFATRVATSAEEWRTRQVHTAPRQAIELARLCQVGTEQVRREIRSEFERVAQGGDADLEDVKARVELVASLQETIEVVKQSAHSSLHPGLSPTVEQLLNDFGVEGQVLVTARPYAMSYELEPLGEHVLGRFVSPDELSDVRLPFLIVGVPRAPLDWPINLCLLFHEIGHAVFKDRSIGAELILPQSPQEAEGAVEVMRQWLEEIFSDAFGLLAVGPAYFHAFCRVLCIDSIPTDCTKSHPPLLVRMRVMSRLYLAHKMAAGVPSEAEATVSGWLDLAESEGPPTWSDASLAFDDATVEFMANTVEGLTVDVAAKAIEVLGARIFSEATGSDDLRRAREIVGMRIAAIEYDDIPSLIEVGAPLPVARVFAINWAAHCIARQLGEVDDSKLMIEHGERLLHSLDAVAAISEWRSANK